MPDSGEHFLFIHTSHADVPQPSVPALLHGFEHIPDQIPSVREKLGATTPGRIVVLSDRQLALADTRSEHLGDLHRFETNVQIINGGQLRCWVFQKTEHATQNTLRASANGGFREEAGANRNESKETAVS